MRHGHRCGASSRATWVAVTALAAAGCGHHGPQGQAESCTGSSCVAITLESLSLTPPVAAVPAGVRQPFTALALFSDGSQQDVSSSVSWTISDDAVASVVAPGLAKANAVGDATVSATLQGLSASATITVTSASLQSLTVSPGSASVPVGVEQQLTVTGTFSDSSTQDLTAQAVWSSSDFQVMAVSNAAGSVGLVTASQAGTATVTATLLGLSASCDVTVTTATLQGISLSQPSATIAAGYEVQFTATGNYSDGSKHDVTGAATWSSSDGAVAAVSSVSGMQGLASGIAAGTATITAALSGLSTSAPVTVTDALLTAIAVAPDLPTVPAGVKVPFTATGIFSDQTSQNLTSQVTWATADSTVATITAAGLAQGALAGATTISATLGSLSGSTTITVTSAALQSLDVFPAAVSIAKGTTTTLQALGTYSDGSTEDLTAQALWTSDGAAVSVSLIQGLAVAAGLSEGDANVTATFSGFSDSAAIAVTAATLTSLTVNPDSASVPVGLSQQLAVTGTFSDSSTQDLTAQAVWSSSAPSVAPVSNTGLVTASQVGTATVVASLLGLSASCDVAVTPATLQDISLSPQSPTVATGYKVQFTATGSYSDGSTHDVTTMALWSSSNGSVAAVSNASGTQGLTTGVAAGTANIIAAIGSVNGSATLTVTSAKITSVAVTPKPFTVAVGGKQQLVAIGTFNDGSTQDVTAQCSWSSSAKSIARVSQGGAVTGLRKGPVTITASKNGKRGSTTGTVN